MRTINESIDVNVPVTEAYNQWTQFETFPSFAPPLRAVRQLDDSHVHWQANVAGTDVEGTAVITQQIPDQLIAWKTTDGPASAGYISFSPVSATCTHVTIQLDYETDGVLEHATEALGPAKLRLREDLDQFRDFMERRRHATGAWRGTINDGAE